MHFNFLRYAPHGAKLAYLMSGFGPKFTELQNNNPRASQELLCKKDKIYAKLQGMHLNMLEGTKIEFVAIL